MLGGGVFLGEFCWGEGGVRCCVGRGGARRGALPRLSSRSWRFGIAGPDFVTLPLTLAAWWSRGIAGPGISSSLLSSTSTSSFFSSLSLLRSGGRVSRWIAGAGDSASVTNCSAFANICGPYQPSASSPRFLHMLAVWFHSCIKACGKMVMKCSLPFPNKALPAPSYLVLG